MAHKLFKRRKTNLFIAYRTAHTVDLFSTQNVIRFLKPFLRLFKMKNKKTLNDLYPRIRVNKNNFFIAHLSGDCHRVQLISMVN